MFEELIQDMFDGNMLLILPASFIENVWDKIGLDEESDLWVTGQIKCRMCGHQALCAWPLDVLDDTALECDWCHNMTAEPINDETIQIEMT